MKMAFVQRSLLQRLRERKEWLFFAALPKADLLLALTWWAVVLLHGILPALFAVAMGILVAAVQRGANLTAPLALVGVVFVLLQVMTPIQTAVSHNLGDRTSAFLFERLTEACLRPQGMAHLEDPALAADRLDAQEAVAVGSERDRDGDDPVQGGSDSPQQPGLRGMGRSSGC